MKNLTFLLSAKLKNILSPDNGSALNRKRTGSGSARPFAILVLFLMLFSFGVGQMMGAVTTYQHVFNSKPSTGDNVTLSSVSWNISATNLGSYNSGNYAGVQLGSSSNNGSITLTSSSNWGVPAGTYYGKTVIKEVRLWLNLGGTSVTPSVTIGGKSATSDGTTVVKNSSAGTDWTKATKVTFTPASDGKTGAVVISVSTVKAGYICCMEIDCEAPAPSVAYTVTYNAGSGSCTASEKEGSAGAGVTLPTPTQSCSSEGWEFYGWKTGSLVTSETPTAPTIVGKGGDTYHPTADITLYAVYVKGEYTKVTSTGDITSGGKYLLTSVYDSKEYVMTNVETLDDGYYYLTSEQIASSSNKYHASVINPDWLCTITISSSKYFIQNSSGGYIDTYYDGGNWYNHDYDSYDKYTIEFTDGSCTIKNAYGSYPYLGLFTDGTFGPRSSSYPMRLYKETTTPSYFSSPVCASCDNDPTVTAASNNGSISSTSIPVQCASGISNIGGVGCSITSYGFVWAPSATTTTPTTSNSSHEVGTSYTVTSTAFNYTITGLTPNTEYTIRPYATNGHGTAYGTAYTVTTLQRYAISYNNNGGSNTMDGAYKDHGVAFALPSTAGSMTKTGYHATGWLLGSSSGTHYDLSGSYTTNAAATFYVEWTINSHTLAWSWGGGSTSATAGTNYTAGGTINYGTAITYPANNTMSRTGYDFNGWNSNATTMPDNDLTITAQWTAKSYTITYKDQGGGDFSGTQTSAPTSHTYGTATTLKIPTKTGYDFGGWFTASDCASGAVGNTTSASLAADGYTANITLYAKWTLHDYTISSTLSNCTSSPSIPTSYTYTGSAAGLSYTLTANSGYGLPSSISVSGTTYTWNSTTGVLTLTGTITSNVSITVTAQPKVTWMAGGEVFNSQQGTSGTTLTNPGAPSSATYCDGTKVFVGWSASTISGTTNTEPTDLFPSSEATNMTIPAGGATYHAVFATITGTYGKFKRVTTSNASTDIVAGQKVAIVAYDANNSYKNWYQLGMNYAGSAFESRDAPSENGSSQINTPDRNDTWKVSKEGDYWVFTNQKSTSKKIAASTTTSNYALSASTQTYYKWALGDNTYNSESDKFYLRQYGSSALTANGLERYSASWKIFEGSYETGQAFQLKLYVPAYTATAYATTCCEYKVTLSGGSPSNGTVEFSPTGPVATCSSTAGDRQTTVTVTPAAGYKLTGWTKAVSGISLPDSTSTISTSSGNTVAQSNTYTFDRNDNGTLTVTATFTAMVDHYIDRMHNTTGYTGDGMVKNTAGYSIPNPGDADDPADDSCEESHYKFVGWIAETYVDSDGTLLDASKLFTASGTKDPSDTNYVAVWAEKK